MKYQVIVADPAWSFDDKLKKMKAPTKRSAESQYPVMLTSEIAALEVPSIVDPQGCLLALWVPSTLLEHGLKVMHAWGFTLKQTYVWVKAKKPKKNKTIVDLNGEMAFGMGRLFRQTHEIALICTAGKTVYPLLENHSQRSVSFDVNEGHSIKPATLQKRLETMFPSANKLELFARRNREGWTCAGNAIDGKDVGVAIQDLKAL